MLTLAVASGKGGVGKSTIAALLALAWQARGAQVALLDSDIFGPSIPTLFGVAQQRHSFDAQQRIVPIRSAGIEWVSFGAIIGDMPAVMRGPMVVRYIEQLLTQVAWHDPDILILDLPPGTGDIHLTITQNLALDGALLISTPHALAIADVSKALLMFNKVQVPILGVVENMAYWECTKCHSLQYPFGNTQDTLQRRFGVTRLTQLPLSREFGSQPLGKSIPPLMHTLVEHLQEALEKQRENVPPEIQNRKEGIYISFEEGHSIQIPHLTLRKACQCALCINERSGQRRGLQIDSQVIAEEIKLVGNYALYIKWSDGHAAGFFPLEQIKKLAAQHT